MKGLKILFLLMILSTCVGEGVFSAVIEIPADYPTIQEGVDAAGNGDTILIANGTYLGAGNRNIELQGKSITVMSAGSALLCMIDCEKTTVGFNIHQGEDQNTVLEGITVKNGLGLNGGGIICDGASPTIRNCSITRNTALIQDQGRGGGIYINNASPQIMNCLIRRNISNEGGGLYMQNSAAVIENSTILGNTSGLSGGGIKMIQSVPMFDGCIISGNSSSSGGGAYITQGSDPLFSTCVFSGNSVPQSFPVYYGGGVHCYEASAMVLNTLFRDNGAYYGGGIAWESSTDVSVINCIFTGNQAFSGAALYCEETGLQLLNVTVASNLATDAGGGIDALGTCNANIVNSIFWNNMPESIGGEGSPAVTYSDIQGGWPGEGNIDAWPEFVNGPVGGYYLSQIAAGQLLDSPCVNAGNDAAANILLPFPEGDVPLSELTTRTDEVPDAGQADMGFHLIPSTPTNIPTNSPTPTRSPTATPTQAASYTPTAEPTITMGVNLTLSEEIFYPNDQFILNAIISNPGPETYTQIPFAVLLDAYGLYFWYPAWTSEFNYENIYLGIQSFTKEILNFQWPNEQSTGSGLIFYGALLTENFTGIIGELGTVQFGWAY